jgi:hypothetical protein
MEVRDTFRLKPEATAERVPEATSERVPEATFVTRGFRLQAEEAADFAPLVDAAPPRRSLADVLADDGDRPVLHGGGDSDRLFGTVVHRLMQRVGFDAGPRATRELAATLVGPAESAGYDGELLDAALDAYAALSRRADVRAVYQSGRVLHEVPFTMQASGMWVRGTIDCLVQQPSGAVTVLEFKTGRPRPGHLRQVELYKAAAARLFPGVPVEARLVYSNEAAVTGMS